MAIFVLKSGVLVGLGEMSSAMLLSSSSPRLRAKASDAGLNPPCHPIGAAYAGAKWRGCGINCVVPHYACVVGDARSSVARSRPGRSERASQASACFTT